VPIRKRKPRRGRGAEAGNLPSANGAEAKRMMKTEFTALLAGFSLADCDRRIVYGRLEKEERVDPRVQVFDVPKLSNPRK